ncbi:MAG TPA: Crp/Fnr family transcriptional regulator [Pirellulales bacterium]|nr:Crp/Fnr family transcriptional regulator [Pirellulales bacterium]
MFFPDSIKPMVNDQPFCPPIRNRLLASLQPQELQRLWGLLEPLHLEIRTPIYLAGEPIECVYFPLNCVVSAMTVMENGSAIEVATIGNEGLAGLTSFFGGEISPYAAMVQLPGDALRMQTSQLREFAAEHPSLRKALIHYNTAFATQVAYAVACNGLHTIEKRCCRWLLMTRDRIGADLLPLTHEFLAIMLGVRRASVTEVLQPLQAGGMIRCGRGAIEIVDRTGLEAIACECYRSVKKAFAYLMG